ncbi:MAG: phage minor head protein [Methylococcaceae bacterium]
MPLNISPTQVAFNDWGDGSFNKPIKEQVDFFRQKLNLPTAHYDDIIQSAHDRAFMVAGAAKADLLDDFRRAIDKAITEGQSIDWFRKEFDKIVEKHGWAYNGERDWRTRIIYTTNIRASYAAGRYAQLTNPDLLSVRPYWKYIHNDTVANPRPLHQSWSGMVLRYDDPFWSTHFPPNGWGCHCRVMAVRPSEYKGHLAPNDGTYTKVDRYGVTHVLPKGIDYGWDYQPGAKTDTSLRQLVQDKLIRYAPAITRALSKDVNRYINATADIAGFAGKAQADKALRETLWLGFVENEAAINSASGEDVKGYLVLLPSDAVNHVDKSHRFDGNGQRPITADDYTQLQSVLTEGDIQPGVDSATGLKRVVATKKIGADTFRAVFEVRPGAKNRSLVLVSLVIKS